MLSKRDIKSLNVGIVYSRFNEPVVKELLHSCVDQLILEGIDEYSMVIDVYSRAIDDYSRVIDEYPWVIDGYSWVIDESSWVIDECS